MEEETRHFMKSIREVIEKSLSQRIEMKLKLKKEKMQKIVSKKRHVHPPTKINLKKKKFRKPRNTSNVSALSKRALSSKEKA